MRRAWPAVLFAVLTVFTTAESRAGYCASLEVTPAAPTTQDPIRVKFSGTWGNGCPIQVVSSHDVGNGVISITASVYQPYCQGQGICNDYYAPWSVERVFAPLSPGPWVVHATLHEYFCYGGSSTCTETRSLEVEGAEVVVGTPGRTGQHLLVSKGDSPGQLEISWPASCSSEVESYGIYQGTLGDFASHAAIRCFDSDADRREEILTPAGDAYFLVVPWSELGEGSYGTSSDGEERPPAAATTCTYPPIPGNCS